MDFWMEFTQCWEQSSTSHGNLQNNVFVRVFSNSSRNPWLALNTWELNLLWDCSFRSTHFAIGSCEGTLQAGGQIASPISTPQVQHPPINSTVSQVQAPEQHKNDKNNGFHTVFWPSHQLRKALCVRKSLWAHVACR